MTAVGGVEGNWAPLKWRRLQRERPRQETQYLSDGGSGYNSKESVIN